MKRLTIWLTSFLSLLGLACASSQLLPVWTATPACTGLMIMPTGEQWNQPEWELRPPETIRRGEVIHIRFSDGYLIYAMGYACDMELRFSHYATAVETRGVAIYLDYENVFTSTCSRICDIEWTVPANLESGIHSFRVNWYETFEINVE